MIPRVLLACALAAGLVVTPGVAQAAPVRCNPEKGSMQVGESWAQRRLDARTVWKLTRGEGITVAVIDSGLDLRHPSLAGAVIKQVDLTRTGHRDCMGHGTATAGIIAGRYLQGVPFHGVAPAARLISYKQTNEKEGDVATLAEGIVKAAEADVDVINVSAQATDQPDLKAAVQYALSRDIVIVAAAGNVDNGGVSSPAYPAAYEGVLSVGSASPGGSLSTFSNTGSRVGVVAPGEKITSTWTGRSFRADLEGTSFAAPYVAGVAALVRARHPRLTNEQVRRRIERTADGALGDGTGAGMVNPLLAVTAVLPSEQVAVAPPPAGPLPDGLVTKRPPVDQHAIDVAVGVGAAALALVGLVLVVRMVVPMGRRRGWRPGRQV
ncbi:type VII secretion-associated serine protease mycosin [Nonomuraea muscovyensis]|uniref:Type VII secretion-associated serine protease mycosin n=1 Tax=Nonomuraea muscovyensis TaxID=1124761 RepID=A0A7X0C8S1_9ACTN|nr:type VII secretion-associated serine protease mycosin [Nonomuraea muscovyensis]MBB6350653.1 type VII secretion-associated serine protease mycosin [Nonomuraea muscovyensis]